ncbi:MAG: hypothetical protein JW744_05730 [Candidatus Diapherotrites archaeon]|uniref:Uncharacterized protein n=1 Tax=Candidatus Iainarchaeum sp. TaxID=3101447 RepID=A0A938YUU1_9ARCH|nr:hypothetical protein [Candidatus Diapherotrites archaeon]
MTFLRVLVDSVFLLQKSPRLFIPKVLVAFFLLPTFILIPHFMIQSGLFELDQTLTEQELVTALEAIGPLFLVVFYGLLVNLVDFFVINPMYPVMVKQYYDNEKVSFKRAFGVVMRRFGTILPALLAILIITFAVMTPVAILITVGILLQSNFVLSVSAVAGFLLVFALFVIFYLVYPISSLERFSFVRSIKETAKTSLKHKVNVSKAFLISLLITGASYFFGLLIALPSSNEQMWAKLSLFALFVFARVMVSIFSTYQYVLNAVFYLGLEKNQFLKVV